ncbi:MAG: hypothetical protein AAF585_10550 [Verrucomicrobiota bacterium]
MKLTPEEMRVVRLNQPRLTSEEIQEQARANWEDLIERGLAPSSENGSSNGQVSTVGSPMPAKKGEKITVASWDLPEKSAETSTE